MPLLSRERRRTFRRPSSSAGGSGPPGPRSARHRTGRSRWTSAQRPGEPPFVPCSQPFLAAPFCCSRAARTRAFLAPVCFDPRSHQRIRDFAMAGRKNRRTILGEKTPGKKKMPEGLSLEPRRSTPAVRLGRNDRGENSPRGTPAQLSALPAFEAMATAERKDLPRRGGWDAHQERELQRGSGMNRTNSRMISGEPSPPSTP